MKPETKISRLKNEFFRCLSGKNENMNLLR